MEDLLLDNESIITRTDDDIVVLTTCRIRYREGKSYMVSLMLDAVTAIEVRYHNWPIILVLSFACLIAGVYALGDGSDDFSLAMFVATAALIAAYFATRRHILRISSPSAFIQFKVKGMGADKVNAFVNKLEEARSEFLKTIK